MKHIEDVRRACRSIVRELGFLDSGASTMGMTHAQCHAMIELSEHGTLTVGELAELLQLDKSSISRAVRQLEISGYARFNTDEGDRRRKPLRLTANGKKRAAEIHEQANGRVSSALALLKVEDANAVVRGMALYAKVLTRSRALAEFELRAIERKDNKSLARLIRTVMPEFGAKGPGFAIMDPEVDDMFGAYQKRRSAYYVVVRAGEIVGGGGFAPLVGGDGDTCELRKMYFYPSARGLGIGEKLLDEILTVAKGKRFTRCYLETLATMLQARKLYEKKGFTPLARPKGNTGHFACDAWYEKKLK